MMMLNALSMMRTESSADISRQPPIDRALRDLEGMLTPLGRNRLSEISLLARCVLPVQSL
jgi:hypothetical protein